MSFPISSIRPPAIDSIEGIQVSSPSSPGAFQSVLSNAMDGVQRLQNASSAGMEKFLAGENIEVHQVALSMTQSQLAFDMFMQVRNKVVSAYQEVMKMQM